MAKKYDNTMPETPSLRMISEASRYLVGKIRRTPIEESQALSEFMGTPVWLKLECLQLTGSFKLRGAFFRLSRLSDAERRKGIVTCSAGNHGKAVAYVSRAFGIKATIYVPNNVDESKYRAIKSLGAELVRHKSPSYDETEAFAIEQARKAGRAFISAFDDEAIMAGNGGSLAVEVLRDCPEARTFVVPVGGGGLAAGFSVYAKKQLRDATMIGCQHEGSPGLKLSLERGKAVTRLPGIETLAGGLEGGLGEKPFAVLKSRIDRVALVSESELLNAVRWMLDRHQYLIEPSAAAPLAACLAGKVKAESPAVLVLTGRNLALPTIKKIVSS